MAPSGRSSDLHCLHPRGEGRGLYPEKLRGATRAIDPSLGMLQHREDIVPLSASHLGIADKLDGTPLGSYLVAVDTVSAGVGEIVLVAQGSSARQTEKTRDRPVDAVIMAIVDNLELNIRETR